VRRIEAPALDEVIPFFAAAAEAAEQATCHRAKCGSVIVKDSVIIGMGYNSPPLHDESRRTCDQTWNLTKKPKYDLTCCVHAEWRAVIDACKRNANQLAGSILYFMRIDETGNFTDAGEPFCTTCSRFTMEAGVAEFALWNNNSADIYPLAEYDQKSYAFYKK
jgi:deoxycytidylate deaminase